MIFFLIKGTWSTGSLSRSVSPGRNPDWKKTLKEEITSSKVKDGISSDVDGDRDFVLIRMSQRWFLPIITFAASRHWDGTLTPSLGQPGIEKI